MVRDRQVLFVVYDGFQLLDMAGPLEVFDEANGYIKSGFYRCSVISYDDQPVRTSSGVRIEVDRVSTSGDGPVDLVLVVGGAAAEAAARDRLFVHFLEHTATRARRFGSVCSGALPLAATGLLDGYRATTHWETCHSLAQNYPQVSVEPDRIFISDRGRWTSAGVTAGIDLALAIVEEDVGPQIAHSVARSMLVFTRRPGGQTQFSTQLRAQLSESPVVRRAQDHIANEPAAPLTASYLADYVGMSERHFVRKFRAETGMTVGSYVSSTRLEAARVLLETTDLTVEVVAKRVGYASGDTLHRVFRRAIATTPSDYRRHFARRARGDAAQSIPEQPASTAFIATRE